MRFISNPAAEEFIPKAEEEHRHSGERYGYSVERGEAGPVSYTHLTLPTICSV